MKQLNLLILNLSLLLSYGIHSQEVISNFGQLSFFPDAEVGMFSDFNNTGTVTSSGGTTYLVKNSSQIVSGSSKISLYNVVLDNANGVNLQNALEVKNLLSFVSGIISTNKDNANSDYVQFTDNASYSGASNANHVDGVVKKVGNDPFSFPVGNGTHIQFLGISAPENVTDSYVVYYTYANPDSSNYNTESMETGIVVVSRCEYWLMKQDVGNSCVNVSLNYDENSCGVYAPNELLISSWDGTQWSNLGNQSVTGDNSAGSVEGNQVCNLSSGFVPMTLASSTLNNPLPVELLNFNAVLFDRKVLLNWQTASEKDNDYFQIERSQDGILFQPLINVDGAGNSNTLLSYNAIDENPFQGTSYYRLKQVDFNGEFSHSETRVVMWEEGVNTLLIYPNPSSGLINFVSTSPIESFKIYSSDGKLVHNDSFNEVLTLNLTPGVYSVTYESDNKLKTKRIVITN